MESCTCRASKKRSQIRPWSSRYLATTPTLSFPQHLNYHLCLQAQLVFTSLSPPTSSICLYKFLSGGSNDCPLQHVHSLAVHQQQPANINNTIWWIQCIDWCSFSSQNLPICSNDQVKDGLLAPTDILSLHCRCPKNHNQMYSFAHETQTSQSSKTDATPDDNAINKNKVEHCGWMMGYFLHTRSLLEYCALTLAQGHHYCWGCGIP